MAQIFVPALINKRPMPLMKGCKEQKDVIQNQPKSLIVYHHSEPVSRNEVGSIPNDIHIIWNILSNR